MKKIYTIEILRFFTAMAIVIYHYQSFFFPYNKLISVNILNNPNIQPFYEYLFIFYKYGGYGVHIFFTISGFVFANVYLSSNRTTTAKEFFFNRLSRLYPLHFLTLIVVMLIQSYCQNSFNNFLIYNNNDLKHFVLNLFFISAWGFDDGYSFNGPIWSVSIEIIIYFIFFILILKLKKLKIYFSFLILIIFLILRKNPEYHFQNFTTNQVIDCAILFFAGVIMQFIHKKIKKNFFLLIIFSTSLLLISLNGNFKLFIFAPAILAIFLNFETLIIKKKIQHFFEIVGNITYGTYLWHIPIQLITIIIIKNLDINIEIYQNKKFFLCFLSSTIIISLFSFYLFEKKAKDIIKKKFSIN
jgi:peptidoglycan/LPS O-acetylase OafA/YrhL